MNICIFIKKPPVEGKVGGFEVQNRILSEGLRELGHKVELIETKKPAGDKHSFEEFTRLNKKYNFDLVVSQSAAGAYYIKNRRDESLPFIVIQHGTLFGEIKTRLREITSLRDILFFIFRIIPYGIKAYILYDFKRLKNADLVIAVSDQVKASLRKEYPFLKSSKIKTIFNGEDLEKYKIPKARDEVREKLGIKNDEVVLLFTGKLFRSKGVHVLLDSFSYLITKNINTKLLILGYGPEERNLRKIIIEHNLGNRANLISNITHDEIFGFYLASDIFVFPTLRYEGLPMSLVEAQAASLPVVASNIGGVPSAVRNGVNGFLVAPGNIGELSNKLELLISDKSKRKKMGENSYKIAEKEFSKDAMINKYNRLLISLVK